MLGCVRTRIAAGVDDNVGKTVEGGSHNDGSQSPSGELSAEKLEDEAL